MVGVLILTHGDLATELLSSARVIAGELENFEALPLAWTDSLEQSQKKVAAALERLDCGAGILILTDIFGGTPSNVAMAFREPGRVEVVSGANLPMVVRLGCLKTSRRGLGPMPLAELATWIRDKAKTSICCGGDLPRPSCSTVPSPARDSEAKRVVGEAAAGAAPARRPEPGRPKPGRPEPGRPEP